MKIMEYLRGAVQALVSQANSEKGLSDERAENALSAMEIAIREGIAQELEQLVQSSAVPQLHGMPNGAPAASWVAENLTPSVFYTAQQDFFRAAANVVRGTDRATEEDWNRQSERMRAMAELNALRYGEKEIFPMPSDAELQRRFEERQERLRDWND